ncbi:MAG TPA: sarcosine oxidase subunit delta [Gaiellaceae bacterium]|jgi:sarcosine oxidase subunit delta
MAMLVPCPNCGPREVEELRNAGETTRRPADTPSVRDLNAYIYFRDNVAGVQREWWFCRVCEDWFLAERHTVTNEVVRTWLPAALASARSAAGGAR